MKIKNNETQGVFLMPKSVIKYLKSAKKTESKLIMYIFANIDEEFDINKASAALSESPEVINAALAYWRGTGIISEIEEETGVVISSAPKADDKADAKEQAQAGEQPQKLSPSYTTEDVANALKSNNEFKQLVSYTEHTIGELLNASKTMSLLYLYDTLGMQCDVIMGIVAHCAEQGKTSVKYIERAAAGIHNDGVVTYKELESYYASKRRFAEYETFVKRLVGAPDRALTPKEAKLVSTWANDYKTSRELVEYAYEITVNSTSKPSIPYMATIIEDWHKKGIDTVDKAKQERENRKKSGLGGTAGANTGTPSSFDNFSFEDIFEKP